MNMGVNGTTVAPHGLILGENEATPPGNFLNPSRALRGPFSAQKSGFGTDLEHICGFSLTCEGPLSFNLRLARLRLIMFIKGAKQHGCPEHG